MLYRWAGREPGAPTVLMAHYDVVPATDEGWEHPPFAADLVGDGDERVLWGRGTLDDKGALVAILEAVDSLVGAGHLPRNDVYLSFGHDEETVGKGAQADRRAPGGARHPAGASSSTRAVRSWKASSPPCTTRSRGRRQREGDHDAATAGRAGRGATPRLRPG